jgi:hypothetical protein
MLLPKVKLPAFHMEFIASWEWAPILDRHVNNKTMILLSPLVCTR